MESSTRNRANKRSNDDDHNRETAKKMKCRSLIIHESVYKFRILLPNGVCLSLRIVDPPENRMPVVVFADKVRDEYDRLSVTEFNESQDIKRLIDWDGSDLCFIDLNDNKLETVIDFNIYQTNKPYTLRLNDGGKGEEVYENLWDLTPDTELLRELPQDYAFETALADLIDNSLQAVWSKTDKSRLICVNLRDDKLWVFDNGPGMDTSEENSIVKWGKIGSSLHRSSRGHAIGGKPPYLKPFFGMFGYGGPMSSMHLGRRTIISSKTKNSKKVCTLYLHRDALLKSSGTDKTWQANGGLRDPSKAEINLSPDGSFTKVEISELKMRSMHVDHLRCKLKDIYFPYIQCDDISKTGRTIMPIEFQVNGIDLAEVRGGEVAVTNLNSCNGPEFVLQLHFTNIHESHQKSPGQGASHEANARLRCIYFPIVQGKENIERILETLEAEGYGVAETFESFSRVSIRCLGRLLPEARWAWLPFMEPKQRKVDRAQILKRCCSRVKCFIETDGGFFPTQSKTDLAHHHPFTTALKNFGSKQLEKERDARVEIFKEGKKVTLQQVEKLYQDWIFEMHDKYDEESECGVDDPVIIINPSNKKMLRISSDVIRVHKLIKRKGKSWKSGQKIKVLKGACAGVYKNNIYAELEYILVEGFEGDAGGDSRIICRQIGVSDDKGCLVSESKDGNPTIDIQQSMSLPISIIDSGKCLSMDTAEWNSQLEKLQQKIPSSIDVLSAGHCEELDVKGSLPFGTTVNAGYTSLNEVIAVVRPASFKMVSNYLDQKHIAVTNFDMVLQIKFTPEDRNLQEQRHIRSLRASPSLRKGFRGLYIFEVITTLLFEKAGEYTFTFQIKDSDFRNYVIKSVRVKALSQVKRWGIVSDTKCAILSARVGSCFPPISVACYDVYENRTTFSYVPEMIAKVLKPDDVLFQSQKIKPRLSSNKLVLTVEKLMVESSKLDLIRPSYKAQLILCSEDEPLDVTIPCQVFPGFIDNINAKPADFMKKLLPGNIVPELVLEVFDACGNHVKQDSELSLDVDGFYLQQNTKNLRVDVFGCVDLSGVLKVAKGYGETVSLSVLSNLKVVFQEKSQTEIRMIRVATKIPESCVAGSQLENVEFEIVDSNGVVDDTINDNEKGDIPHTLSLKSDSGVIDDSVRYSFRNGRCTVRSIPIPHIEGSFSFCAAHSRYLKLNITITVHVEPSLTMSYESMHPLYNGETTLLHNSYGLITPKVEHENIIDVHADRAIVPVNSPNSAKERQNFIEILHNERKELVVKVLEYGRYIGDHEQKLEILQNKRLTIEKDLSELEGLMDPVSVDDSRHLREKEIIQGEIEIKSHSAASIVCKILKSEKHSDIYKDIVGVVALLGTVQTNELSRVLAEFLGEETMLSVVCKNYKAAVDLEAGDSNAFSSVDGRYNVICLEDIRPYDGSYSSGDPQRMLLLSDPTLPSGKSPAGFLGYAVNMIYLDAHELYIRVSCDKGLRETLFYNLLGELQVYKTRENVIKALQNSCVHNGAVSLDGAIIRRHGVLSLGRSKPSVHFPVVQSQQYNSPNSKNLRIQRLFESKQSMLGTTISEIEKESESRDQSKKKFGKYKEKLEKFHDEKAPILKNLGLQEFCSMELNPTPPQSDYASSS